MAWMYTVSVERPQGKSEAEAEVLARLQYPSATLALATKRRVLVFIPAQIPTEVASILAKSPSLLKGSTDLIWFEPFMEADIRATVNPKDCGCALCRLGIGTPPSSADESFPSSLLAEILRSAKKSHEPS